MDSKREELEELDGRLEKLEIINYISIVEEIGYSGKNLMTLRFWLIMTISQKDIKLSQIINKLNITKYDWLRLGMLYAKKQNTKGFKKIKDNDGYALEAGSPQQQENALKAAVKILRETTRKANDILKSGDHRTLLWKSCLEDLLEERHPKTTSFKLGYYLYMSQS